MYLKEAFRYQNYLDKMIDCTTIFLEQSSNITRKKQIHYKSKAKNGAEDEEIVIQQEKNYESEISDMIDFMVFLVDEKQRLSEAINIAKTKCGFDIDAALLTNKARQRAIASISEMALVKSGERMSTGTAYTFNINGDQTAYKYDIKEVTTIDFDRNKVKKLKLSLSKIADEISSKCDIALSSTEVDFTPTFDVNENDLDDSVRTFLEKRRSNQ